MVSIRDYAKMNNVSYEAIRQQVKRYEDELNGHIIKQNRTQFLDDVAVDILDQHRKENPVVIINKDTDSRLKQLEDENKNLLSELLGNKLPSSSQIASKGFVHTLESHKGFVHTNRLRDVYIQSENVLYTHFIF